MNYSIVSELRVGIGLFNCRLYIVAKLDVNHYGEIFKELLTTRKASEEGEGPVGF